MAHKTTINNSVFFSDHELKQEEFNILLIQLPLPSNERVKRIVPMALISIASYLRENLNGINISVLDAQSQNLNYTDIVNVIQGQKWNVVGMGYWTVQYYFACNISMAIKGISPDIKIVHGGVHPSLFPEDALKVADYCVIGEGEITFKALIEIIQKNNDDYLELPGLAFKKPDGTIKINKLQQFIQDLDSLPFPSWDLIDVNLYRIPLHITGTPMLPIIGSRGCPYECNFCVSPAIWKRKVRFRSAENIVDEIENIVKTVGVKGFHFWDDNLLLKPKIIERICNLILERNLDIEWVGLSRAEHINRSVSLLPLLKKAGCIGIEVGIESVNPSNYKAINKHQDISDAKLALENQKKAGLFPLYTYMVFNPGETIDGYYFQKQFLDTIQSGLEWFKFFHYFTYPLYLGQFCTPYPGTPLFDHSKELGLILLDEWEDRHHHQINFIPNSLLDDVPVLNAKIDDNDYYLYFRATITAFWNEFPANIERQEGALLLSQYYSVLYFFFRKCDGSHTLRQIIVSLTRICNTNFTFTARAAALATYIFAQLGIIRSGIHDLAGLISPIKIIVPDDEKKYIKSLLELLAIKTANFNTMPEHISEKNTSEIQMANSIKNNSNLY